MESDNSDAECIPDLESPDDFLASSFDVDDEDEPEAEGSQENIDSLGLEPYRFEPFMEGAKHGGSDSESQSDWAWIPCHHHAGNAVHCWQIHAHLTSKMNFPNRLSRYMKKISCILVTIFKLISVLLICGVLPREIGAEAWMWDL